MENHHLFFRQSSLFQWPYLLLFTEHLSGCETVRSGWAWRFFHRSYRGLNHPNFWGNHCFPGLIICDLNQVASPSKRSPNWYMHVQEAAWNRLGQPGFPVSVVSAASVAPCFTWVSPNQATSATRAASASLNNSTALCHELLSSGC